MGYKAPVATSNSTHEVRAQQLQAFCSKNLGRLGLKKEKHGLEDIIKAIRFKYETAKKDTLPWIPNFQTQEYGNGSVERQSPLNVLLPQGVWEEDEPIIVPADIRRHDALSGYDDALQQQREAEMQAEYKNATSNRSVTRSLLLSSMELQAGVLFGKTNVSSSIAIPTSSQAAMSDDNDDGDNERRQPSPVLMRPPPNWRPKSTYNAATSVGKSAFDHPGSDDDDDDEDDEDDK